MLSRYLIRPVATPSTEFGERLRPALHVSPTMKPCSFRRMTSSVREVPDRDVPAVVAGDQAAQGHAAKRVHVGERGVEAGAADVLEQTVDALGRGVGSARVSERRSGCAR